MLPMALTEEQVVILYFLGIKYNYIDQSVVCVSYHSGLFRPFIGSRHFLTR